MATLTLLNLHCYRQQDITGKDEYRIKVDGTPVCNGVIDKNGDDSLKPTPRSSSRTTARWSWRR